MLSLWPHWQEAWVLHRDEHLLVVDKPAGMATQASEDPEVVDLRARLAKWLGGTTLGLAHPADRDASGVVLLSLGKQASRSLAEQLARGLRRTWVVGLGGDSTPRIDGVQAERIARRQERSLWRLTTAARSQPLRRQLADLGRPIAGDRENEGPPASRLLLHAETVRLVHPAASDTLGLEAALPAAFERWLDGSAERLPEHGDELRRRLAEAIDRRYGVARRGDTDAFRLVHGGGDDLPGIELDLYGEHAVLALRSDEACSSREAILDAVEELGVRGIYVKLRPRQANVVVDTRRDELAPRHALRGDDAPDPLVVREGGIEYRVRLGDGLSTGIFLDQRRTREQVRASSGGKRVLNLFAYHGAFSVAAALGGAAATVSVDAAQPALDAAREALVATGADMDRHELVCDDVLAFLERSRRRRRDFDLVLLDPPSYATTKRSRFRAERDYRSLAAAALPCVASGGLLLACTNHRGIVQAKLRRQLRDAARDAGVTLAMRDLAPPIDFPPPPGRPPHLKTVLAEVTR